MRLIAIMMAAVALLVPLTSSAQTIDERINAAVEPAATALSAFIFYKVALFGSDIPLIVVWLIIGAAFFTLYLGFINLRGFRHALDIVAGRHRKAGEGDDGEVSHFQALATAVSGTVGIGNMAGVAVMLSLGGPGAAFWLAFAGLLGMTTKFVECTLGVKYRRVDEDGTVSGGPMYYLERGFAGRGFAGLGRGLGLFFAAAIVLGCLGIGNMFQSNQAYEQLVSITGKTASPFTGHAWAVGLFLAVLVGLVIVGGIRSIARVTSRLVPLMVFIYLLLALLVLMINIERLPGTIALIVGSAFSPGGIAGGLVGVMILGFQRAAFSNEAGLGSASIAHSAVRTAEPLTEGFVALLEPFIDTVVICMLTALVILTTLPVDMVTDGGLTGISLTLAAFTKILPWSGPLLGFAAMLFAISTMIAWAYYGQRGWLYLVGKGTKRGQAFNLVYCLFIVIGCSIPLGTVLDFADALIFVMAIPNLIGLYVLGGEVKRDLDAYWGDRDKVIV